MDIPPLSLYGVEIRYRPLYPPAYRHAFGPFCTKNWGPGATRSPKDPLEGSVGGNVHVSQSDARVKPFLDFRKQPHNTILAEPDPLGERPSRFEPCNMLAGIRDATDSFQLLFGHDLLFISSHRTSPLIRERRRPGLAKPHQWAKKAY